MPKKTKTAATARARRKAVLAFTAKLFRDCAGAMAKADGTQARFAALAERLAGQAPELRSLDRKTDARLIQAIADGAGAVAALLRNKDEDRPPSRQAAKRAAEGLDRLSDAFLKGAGSLRLLPAKSKSKKSKINARIRSLHEEAVDLAQDYHGNAMALRNAAGLELPQKRAYFRVPELVECADGEDCCGCEGTQFILPGPIAYPPLPAATQGPARSGGKADLASVMRGLDTTGRLTATHLKGLATLLPLALISGSITCSDSCAPVGVVRVTHCMTYAIRGKDGNYYPSIGFLWILCCACPCYYVFTEQRQERWECWGQITVLAGKATREEANREATRLGREMASDYNAALSSGTPYKQPDGITPRFEPPQCSCYVL